MRVALVLAAAGLAGLSGLPALLPGPLRKRGAHSATVLAVAASALGLGGAALALAAGRAPAKLVLPWGVPGGLFAAEVDSLSAVFLIPLFLVSGLGALFGESYWSLREHPESAPRLRLFYGAMTGAMALVLVARNAFLFLTAWEVMALAAFFLVTTESHERRVREAGWHYLVATHAGTLLLFGLFALLRTAQGSFEIARLPSGVAASPTGSAIFFLALVGFGLKAGLMPLHIWLPGAHAAAPSHVSALMSGVLIKMGIYGLLRITTLFPDPPLLWGAVLFAMGVASAVLGVAFALGQHDLKRLLAYHSVENVGIIAMALGLGLVGRSLRQPAWVLLGFGGGLLHVVNHGLFKSLLFYSAGSVIHAAGTREMDRLGGLLKRLPATGLGFLVGAVAICGLPPLNGFVSEFLLYVGLLSTLPAGAGPGWIWGAFAVPLLALVGALALACFVKAFGSVFLGQPRTEGAISAHESALIVVPMALLALLCAGIGLFPVAVVPFLERAAAVAAPELASSLPRLPALAPLRALGLFALGLTAFSAGVGLVLFRMTRQARRSATWDCGYAAPTPRMQYTSSSFASWTVGFFRWALLPRAKAPVITRLFPPSERYESHVPDTVLDRFLVPSLQIGARLASWGRYLQRGLVQIYIFYIMLTVVILLFLV
ncbi:MAG TPA: proton-conducting transporter membrane subunit [Thermoanaerobaculia bacterium]|nr:proton-conducting transporter membrane subunit [Thermoanaerobaculia bacterium]